ncbi:hypothetical protein PpBr36_01696 [Pyricularia pennisetigena]|uniref:hypothetical protein n=1 Tax=Pyricularia pennisetigena TaxID=1578925 RepID=UPI001151C9CF|nr:hypothetical protein PpBr36_01696 [Pyricularia pennisetigena]TLS29221.1 hypothetical protein PpBr36_01696 [Pyricularia pennisetigena]
MSSVQRIPTLYRIMLSWVEPAFCASGTVLATFDPTRYIDTMTTNFAYDPPVHRILLDQIGAVYLLMAFNSAVVLRVTDDLRVWKAVMGGIWVSDMLHIWATVKELGVDVILNPLSWRAVDWINLGILVGMMLLRIAFIFEVGFEKQSKRKLR